MGPEATVDFMRAVIRLTGATCDQDHLHVIVDSNPQVPDRQAALRGEGGDVGASLAAMAEGLARAGADFLVMPCNTPHVFAQSIVDAVPLPFINIIDVTVAEIGRVRPGTKSVGILATTGCLDAGIYQQALLAAGYGIVLPREVDRLMQLIFRVKSGDSGQGVRQEMLDIARQLVEDGADGIIAGCTEIPLVLEDGDLAVPLISSTEVLARRSVEFAEN